MARRTHSKRTTGLVWFSAVACGLAAVASSFIHDEPGSTGGLIAVAVTFGIIGATLGRGADSTEEP